MKVDFFQTRFLRLIALTAIVGFIIPAIGMYPYSRLDGSIKRVVIDPGHGGHDSGNGGTGRYKAKEKDISLEVSLMVGEYIKKNIPGVEVIYTRTTDKAVDLKERTAMANRMKGDLYISIHCNAHTTGAAYGTETFVMGLSREQSNLEVAKRENSVIFLEDDYENKYEGFDPNNPVGAITAMISANSFLDQSVRFADLVETEFREKANRPSRGVKQSVLYVLDFTHMPSVLIELGFLTNKPEEDFLNTKNGKELMASAIYRAFKTYKEEHDAVDQLHVPEPPLPANKKPEPKTTSTSETKKPVPKQADASQTQAITQGNVVLPVFKIQMMSSSKQLPITPQNFNGLTEVDFYQEKNIYKYTFGNYATLEEAKQALPIVRSKGYKDAFVVAFLNGNRIDPIEASKIKP